MADPRDVAQQWLTDRLSQAGCADSTGVVFARVDVLVDAILDEDGVTVDVEYSVTGMSGAYLTFREDATHQNLVIRLPAGELEASDAS